MKYKNVLFDLDGTLTDPKLGITNSIRYALAHFCIEEPDTSKLEAFIGPPLNHSFMQFYGFSEEEAWEAVDQYRVYFKKAGMYENTVYLGISELLDLLNQQDRCIYVATSKPRVFAEQIIAYFGLSSYFIKVYGSELDGTYTDKKELIAHLLTQEKLNSKDTVMIGDREYDVIGAKENGVDAIAVAYGYGVDQELQCARPTYIAQSVDDLTDLFV